MEIKKPQYIRKYDFIRYFTRNEDEWFWPTKKVIEYIDNKAKILDAKEPTEPDDEDDEYESDEKEFDSYEYKKENEDMDKNDPKIHEGNIIDRESKEFIKAQFSKCKKIYDFDNLKLSNDDAFIKTKELLENDDNFIMFQPTFIYKNKAINKPDAFIKQNNEYILIETKGTTSVKRAHLIDLTYQHIVINDYLEQINVHISQYYLCLIDYRVGQKNELGFCLSKFACITKGGWGGKKIAGEKYSSGWVSQKKTNKTAASEHILYFNLINNYSKYIPDSYLNEDDGLPNKKWNNFVEQYKNIRRENNFETVINELSNHTICNKLSLEPTSKYKCWFKDNDYWLNIRDYYIKDTANDKHQLFSYSGFLIKFDKVYKDFYMKNKTTHEMFESFKHLKSKSEIAPTYYRRAMEKEVFNDNTKELFNKLKTKKVYFDFESINLASRVIDNTFPFMQCVNQVSIIIDDGNGVTSQTKCNNLLFDPLNMDKEKYKQIVDAILPHKDDLPQSNQYSYIVFNKSFEKSRLQEMDWIINDKEYSKKIEVIVENIYDLADFFDVRKKGYICLPELKGFYSIKKILPLVKTKQPKIYNDVGCVDYKIDLEIHNGSDAQMYATKRFFNLPMPNGKDWSDVVDDLKKYCENDVRAMVAIEYFVKKILNK